jgi:hypothetical protein
LKRLERHREWFTNPPAKKPAREDFGLGHMPIVSEAVLKNTLSIPSNMFQPEYYAELQKEKAYREAKSAWENYERWLTERNPVRRETEKKFGYDTKFAAHVFRLIEEGRQLLLNGEIEFPLWNAEYLLEIRNGVFSYEQILEDVTRLNEAFAMWERKSILPDKPNVSGIRDLYFDVLRTWLDMPASEANDECIHGYRMDDEE